MRNFRYWLHDRIHGEWQPNWEPTAESRRAAEPYEWAALNGVDVRDPEFRRRAGWPSA